MEGKHWYERHRIKTLESKQTSISALLGDVRKFLAVRFTRKTRGRETVQKYCSNPLHRNIVGVSTRRVPATNGYPPNSGSRTRMRHRVTRLWTRVHRVPGYPDNIWSRLRSSSRADKWMIRRTSIAFGRENYKRRTVPVFAF